jgi:hypothetical protein
MSRNVKPLPGRHRATGDARSTLPSAAFPVLLSGVVVVLLGVVLVWQVA